MSELFSLNSDNKKSPKPNEYKKAYNLVYSFTDNKKLQDKLIDYVQFRINNCKEKGFRFYSSCIKSFLDSITTEMNNCSDDEIWEAVNLTLSYPSMRLLVPYKNNYQSTVSKSDYSCNKFESGYKEKINNAKVRDENGNLIGF